MGRRKFPVLLRSRDSRGGKREKRACSRVEALRDIAYSRGNKSGKNESIGGVFRDAPSLVVGVGVSNRRSQADLEPPFCDNGQEGVCLSDWLIYGLLSSRTSFYRLFGCLRRVLQPPGNAVASPLPPTLPLHPL